MTEEQDDGYDDALATKISDGIIAVITAAVGEGSMTMDTLTVAMGTVYASHLSCVEAEYRAYYLALFVSGVNRTVLSIHAESEVEKGTSTKH